jgi:hypothetical protein
MSKVALPPTQALELAAGIVLQHNLLRTATDAERRATIDRLLNWWNFVAVPILDGKPVPDWAQPLIEELRLLAESRKSGSLYAAQCHKSLERSK